MAKSLFLPVILSEKNVVLFSHKAVFSAQVLGLDILEDYIANFLGLLYDFSTSIKVPQHSQSYDAAQVLSWRNILRWNSWT
jgi:hypothetical protein